MNYNKYTYYRANPFVNNDFIPITSMNNRKPKQFISEIPQGLQYYSSKTGKRTFKEKVFSDQIEKDNILQSPQKYPYENRIALDKNYRRNLNTIDIEGASSGTKVSESIRNKHKALQQLRKRNKQEIKSPINGESLDEVYEKQRREIAQRIHKNIEMRKTRQQFNNQNENNKKAIQLSKKHENNFGSQNLTKYTNQQMQEEYQRYVSGNSNKKYQSIPSNPYEFNGFQRYKRPENHFQTLDSYNNGRIPQVVPKNQINYTSYSTDKYGFAKHQNQETNIRSSSIEFGKSEENSQMFGSNKASYFNNGGISINNRHRSNPEYVENYPMQFQKRAEQVQKNRQVQSNLKQMYQNDRVQFRRNNPTNLSFNIAAKSTLMGPII